MDKQAPPAQVKPAVKLETALASKPNATAAESQRQRVVEVLKAAAMRDARERLVQKGSGGDPYNTAERKLPKNVPWQHLTRKV